jgi:hypothetical protein
VLTPTCPLARAATRATEPSCHYANADPVVDARSAGHAEPLREHPSINLYGASCAIVLEKRMPSGTPVNIASMFS